MPTLLTHSKCSLNFSDHFSENIRQTMNKKRIWICSAVSSLVPRRGKARHGSARHGTEHIAHPSSFHFSTLFYPLLSSNLNLHRKPTLSRLTSYLVVQNFRDESTETLLTGAKLKHHCNRTVPLRCIFLQRVFFFCCRSVRTFQRAGFVEEGMNDRSI